MTKEDIKAALMSTRPIKIVLTEEEEVEVANFVFGDRTVGTDSKDAAIKLFQETLDIRVDRILEEVRLLLEQREEQLADLQQIALELLKDKIIERMTPRLSLLQRQKLKSQALLWDIDLNCADVFGEFGMKVEKYANDFFPRRAPGPTGIDGTADADVYVIEGNDPAVEHAVHFSEWLNGRRR